MPHVSEKLKKIPENMKNYILNNPISMLFMFSSAIGTGWNFSYLINGKPSGDFGGDQPEIRGSLFVMVLFAILYLGSRLGKYVDLAVQNWKTSDSKDNFWKTLLPNKSPNAYGALLATLALIYASYNFLLQGISLDPNGNNPKENFAHFGSVCILFSIIGTVFGYGLDRLNEVSNLTSESKPLIQNYT